MNFYRFVICVFALMISMPAVCDAQRTRNRKSDDDDKVSFVKDVAPIINAKCGRCHVTSTRGRYNIKSYKALMNSDSVTPDEPGDSYFIEVIENGSMPKGGLKVDRDELKILKKWISQGAEFDGDRETQAINTMAGAAGTQGDRGRGGRTASGRGRTPGARAQGGRTQNGRSQGGRTQGGRSRDGQPSNRGGAQPSPFDANKLLAFLDKNGDGKLSLSEIDATSRLLRSLDSNEDDQLTPDEVEEFGDKK